MKYFLIPFIALGLMLSVTIGIVYTCEGQGMFPEHYGSPFVFKVKSLGSSMTYFYSISGLFLNISIWIITLIFLRKSILYLLNKLGNNKYANSFYKATICLLTIYSTFNILIESSMVGTGFDKTSNYWYYDMDNETKLWDFECNGNWVFL